MIYDAYVEVKDFEDLDTKDVDRPAMIVGTMHRGVIHKFGVDRLFLLCAGINVPFKVTDRIIFLDNVDIQS